MMNDKKKAVAKLLIENRVPDKYFGFGWISKEKSPSLKEGNKFLLGCIIDHGVLANVAWKNAENFAEIRLHDPERLWHEIVSEPLETWNEKWKEYKLHQRWPKSHERVWTIGKRIMELYDGDARKIWEGQSVNETLRRLNDIHVGELTSRMVVGALLDAHLIQGKGDVKADTHVRRVLGRVFEGRQFSANRVGDVNKLAGEMYPENPWCLDRSLYLLGRDICRTTSPECHECYLEQLCSYHNPSSS